MTHARGAVLVTAFSTLSVIPISCTSDKPSAGQQNPTCTSTQTLCKPDAGAGFGGPYCADLQADNANCGSCGSICTNGKVCSLGICTCATDETLCGAGTNGDAGADFYCANTKTDNANCGCCGNTCGPNQACRDGRCDDTTNFSFFVFADMHVVVDGTSNYNAFDQTAMQQMTQIDPHVMGAFSNGDLVDDPADGSWAHHDDYVAAPAGFQLNETCAASFGAQPRYFASVGDHDDTGGGWYPLWNQHLPAQQNLGQNGDDGIYFSVKYGNAFFVMLDSEHATPTQADAQTKWLKSTLEGAEAQAAQLKFIFFHQPVYPCDGHHSSLTAALPWVDLAEQHQVNVIFGSHTHVYTRTCPKRGGKCTADGTGIIFVETGALGGLPRAVDATDDFTASGMDAEGNPRTDAYNCLVGGDLKASHGSDRDFCHVRVDGCQATVNCYVVADGNTTPFDTWTVNGCACDPDAGQTCNAPTDGGTGN